MNLGQDNVSGPLQGIPGIYLLLLCDLIKQFGLEEQALLDGMAVTRADLLRGDSRITMKMGHLAAQRATAMAGDRGLGMAYAQALKVTMHGSVGLVAMTSPNIGAALQAMARFIALRAPFFQAEFSADDQGMWVALNPTRDMDPPIRTFITEAILIGVTLMAEQLLGRPLRDAWVEMAGAEPPYYRHYRQRLPAPVRYGGVHCRLRMPVDLCQAVPQLADPAAADLARQQCEQEYQQLFSRQETLAHKIARHLRDSPRGQALPSQEVIARRFHLSSRTLKRRLQELGTCYRELVEEELKQRAMQLLAETRLDISQVADQLGYRDLGTFSTAFNRWTNRTPRDFRRQSLNPSTNQ